MKNYIYTVQGGGVFSRILQCAIQPLSDIEFDNVFISLNNYIPPDPADTDEFRQLSWQWVSRHETAMRSYGIADPYSHIPGYILDQRIDESYRYMGFLPIGQNYTKVNKIEESPDFYKYKQTLKKLKFQPEIYSRLEAMPVASQISSKTLGVHVRLTSMNMAHREYQAMNIESYIRDIKTELETGEYTNVFVASDNHESIRKLQSYFGDLIIYHDGLLRYNTEILYQYNDALQEFDWFYQKRFWQESLLEALSLSRSGALICRESNFTNMSILLSESMKKFIRIY